MNNIKVAQFDDEHNIETNDDFVYLCNFIQETNDELKELASHTGNELKEIVNKSKEIVNELKEHGECVQSNFSKMNESYVEMCGELKQIIKVQEQIVKDQEQVTKALDQKMPRVFINIVYKYVIFMRELIPNILCEFVNILDKYGGF